MNKHVGWIVLLLISFGVYCQDVDQLDDANSEANAYFSLQKIDINQSSKEEFQNLLFLNSQQIEELIQARSLRPFHSIYELQSLPSWDIAVCRRFEPFLIPIKTIEFPRKFLPVKFIFRSNTTFEEKKGFSLPTARSKVRYLGDPWGHYLRLQLENRSGWGLGLSVQKDPGETRLDDFLSANLHYLGTKSRILIGDFTSQWSQGLILSGGFYLGKSYQTIQSTQKIIHASRPYTSSGESNFYRGISYEQFLGNFRLQVLACKNPIDATISTIKGVTFFNTIYTDGFHRTNSELLRKKSVEEEMLGMNLGYYKLKFHLELNGLFQSYSLPKIAPVKDYQLKNWYGTELWNFSLAYGIYPNNTRWVGEVAFGNRSWAMVHGVIMPFSKKFTLSILARYYQAGYYARYGQGFGENSTTNNEIGLYAGEEWQISKRKKLSIYQDFFVFPYLKYLVSSKNSFGWEILGRMQWNQSQFSQLKYQSKQEDGENNSLVRLHQIQLYHDVVFSNSRNFKFHSRLAYTNILQLGKHDQGLSFLMDQQWQWRGSKWIFREWIFSTQDYDSRIYGYEPGLIYNFSIPAVYDKGIRMMAVWEQKIAKHWRLGIKCSRLHYFNKNLIGSSYDEIQGHHKTDIILQLVFF